MSEPAPWRSLGLRWLKFNAVGALGVGVQLGALALLVSGFRLNYLLATALAVELAVLHNFVWHERFTWKDRVSLTRKQVLGRLARFHLSNGAISLAGNILLMRLLTGALHVNYLAANIASIATLSIANFAASHTFVFRPRQPKADS